MLERTRRYQYVATIAVTLLVGTLLVPAKNAGYETFLIDGYRGIYNSAWIGATFAILASMLLSLFGFYNVKSAVERDRTTRVGEIVAATSMARFDYALGKALSNFLVLGSMAAILFVVAIAMQFVRGESAAFDLGQIAAPFALVVLPADRDGRGDRAALRNDSVAARRSWQRGLFRPLDVVFGLERSGRSASRAVVERLARRKSRDRSSLVRARDASIRTRR